MDLSQFYQEALKDFEKLKGMDECNKDYHTEIAKKYICIGKSIHFDENFRALYGDKQLICVKGILNCLDMVYSFSEKLVTKEFVVSMLQGLNKLENI